MKKKEGKNIKKNEPAVKGPDAFETSLAGLFKRVFGGLKGGEGALYTTGVSLLIIFLSSLALTYLIYGSFNKDFDVLEFVGKNSHVFNPGGLTAILAGVFTLFVIILYFDKSRILVLLHHAFSFCMLAFYFLGFSANGWAEYDRTVMIVSLCLCLSFYFGLLLEKLFMTERNTAGFIEKRGVYLLAAFSLFYLICFCRLALARHCFFYSQTYDLAWEHQVLHNLATTGFPQSTIESVQGVSNWGDHASFIYYLLAPFYLLYPKVEFLLVIQPAAITAAGLLIYIYAKKALNSGTTALVLSLAFLMHPCVQGYMLEDFHPSVLALPVFFAFLIFAYKNDALWTIVLFVILAAVREDMAFFSIFVAAYMTVSKKISAGRGIMLGAVSIVMMLLCVWTMHAAGGGVYLQRRFYTIGQGVSGVIAAAIANPLYIFTQAFTPEKINFLLIISAPLLFVFIFDAPAWIMLALAFMFGVFSNYAPHYTLGYHYSVMFVCAVFLGAVTYMSRKKPAAVLLGAMVAMAFFMNYFYGNMFSKSYRLECTGTPWISTKPDYINNNWTGLYRVVTGVKDPEAEKIMSSIPGEYKVAADFFAAPHVSGRKYIYQISGYKDADIVINKKGKAPYPDYIMLRSTVLWDFYARSFLVKAKKTGVTDDGKVFFKDLN